MQETFLCHRKASGGRRGIMNLLTKCNVIIHYIQLFFFKVRMTHVAAHLDVSQVLKAWLTYVLLTLRVWSF